MKILSTQFINIAKLALNTFEFVSELVLRANYGVSFFCIEALGFVATDSRVACQIHASISALDPSISKAV